MSRISDSVLTEIMEARSCGGLPVATARALFRTTHLLLASRSLEDVGIFAKIQKGKGGRFQVPVIGKWAISFRMSPDNGPSDMRLEKLGKNGA